MNRATELSTVDGAGSGARVDGARGLVGALSIAAGVALLLVVVATPLDLRAQAVFSAGVFAAALLLARRSRGSPTATLLLMIVSLTISARYMTWRLTHTVAAGWTVDAALSALLLVAELYAFAMLLLGYVQTAWPLRREPVPLPEDPSRWPTVDVFIPTYDEPLEVVRTTVLAARALDWPASKLSIHLLDDGRRTAFREFAARAGVGYVVRPDNAHAKAGNLNHALARTRGEFVAVFDCDHVPTRAFLQLSMGWFLRDPRISVVQLPHTFYTPDPFERNLRVHGSIPNESQLFYGLIQPGNDLWNAAFFCGSSAVLRRAALEDVGGFAVETVTEDAHTALRMHRRGWRSAYLDVPLSAGLATETLAAHVGQRIRWARGMAQIFRLENPLLARGLGLWQRLCYLAATLHFFSALPRLVYLTVPALYLLLDRHVFNSAPMIAIAYALPHLGHVVVTTSRVEGAYRQTFWSEVYDSILAPYTLLPTTLALVDPRRGRFGVTGKGGLVEQEFFDRGIARPGLALAALNLACVAVGAWKLWSGYLEADAIAINVFWAAHNLLILGAGLAVALERQQTREAPRLAVRLRAALQTEDERTLPCETLDLARRGARVRLAPTGREFRPGERIWLSIPLGAEEVPLPAAVVAHEGSGLRVRFGPLNLEEESHLVQAMFSRADAWRAWRERRPSSPLRALLDIAWLGARGAVQAALPAAMRPAAAVARELPEPPAPGVAQVPRLFLAALVAGGAALAGPASAQDAGAGPASAAARTAVARPEEDARGARSTRVVALTEEQRDGIAREVHIPFAVRSDRVLAEAVAEIAFDATQRVAGSLEVLVNRRRVALFDADRLARERPVQQVEIGPAFLGDRNVLTLRLASPGADGCAVERGSWRFVKGVRIVQVTHPQALPDDLALLPLPFVDRDVDEEATIPLVLPPDPSPGRLRAAALVASWFGVNNGLPLRFPVRLGELPASRAVVLLDGADAASALGLPPPEVGGIRIMDHPRHPGAGMKLLVISGRDLPDLERVALALAANAMTLAGASVVAPAAPVLPRSLPYDAPRFVPAGQLVPLGKYPGVESLALEGGVTGSIAVRFRIAPDLWLWPREHVPLDLGYAMSLDAASGVPRVDVAINGRHLGSLPPPAPGQRSARVTLPVPRELLRGFNELRVHVRYPEAEGRCVDAGAPSAARVAIAPDSVLHLEGLRHFASLPDVSLFVYDGFPFTRIADLSQTAVVLPDRPRPEEIATALSIVAQLGAMTGRIASGVAFLAPGSIDPAARLDKDLLLVGVAADHALVRRWADRLPVAVASGGSRARLPSLTGWLALLNPIFAYEELRRAEATVAGARELAAVIGLDSPLASGRSAVVVTGTAAQRMPSFVDLAGFAESRSRVNDVLVLTDEAHALFRIGATRGHGEVDPLTRVRWAFSNDWLLLVPALFGGAALVAVPARRSLTSRARRRLGLTEGGADGA